MQQFTTSDGLQLAYAIAEALQRPLVCLDETSKQLIIEMRAPIPAKDFGPWIK